MIAVENSRTDSCEAVFFIYVNLTLLILTGNSIWNIVISIDVDMTERIRDGL